MMVKKDENVQNSMKQVSENFQVNEILEIEQEAKSIALQKQVLKKDSKLNMSLASTWASHSELEKALNQLKTFIHE